MDIERIRSLFVQLSVFVLVAALWFVGVTLWSLWRSRQRDRLERRLRLGTKDADSEKVLRLWHDGQAVEALVPQGERGTLLDRLERTRQDAGWKTPLPKTFLMLIGIIVLLWTTVVLCGGRMLVATALAAAVLMIFRWYLLRCINKRTALMEKQLVEALDLGARSLRAGHPLSGAFRLIAKEIGPPLNSVFAEIVDQESLGLRIQDSLAQAAGRSHSADMKIFATSVIIQLRSGGNLAEMMERVAWVIRDRMRLNRRARVLTSEAQLSKWLLLALPIGLFIVLSIMNRDYMDPFFNTSVGAMLLAAAGTSLVVGAWMMNRLSVLKY